MNASVKAQIVSFRCVLRDRIGQVLSSTFNQDVITDIRNPGTLLRGLAEGLQNLRQGEVRHIFLPAERAYGFYDPNLLIEVPRSRLTTQKLKAGEEAFLQTEDGRLKSFRVVGFTDAAVLLDGNHPLAGQDLDFEIETLDARDATSQELAEASGPDSEKVLH